MKICDACLLRSDSRGKFSQIREFLQSLENMQACLWLISLKLEFDVKTGKDVADEVSLAIFVGNSQKSGYTVCSE
jgi:hypothetical protein